MGIVAAGPKLKQILSNVMGEDVHPASIVSPASWKATENRENGGGPPTIDNSQTAN
jgi:hypothetical protein